MMRQGNKQIDPRLGRVLAEIHNRFNNVAIAGDDAVQDLLMGLEQSAMEATSCEDDVLRQKLIDIAVGSLALITSIDMQAEIEFHRQRRMFYLIGDLVNIGIEGDERSHREWMRDEGDEDSYDETIRGYVDKTGVYAYKGHDFSLSPAAEAEFGRHLPALVELMNIDAVLPVWAGVVPGQLGTKWQGRKRLGLVKDVLNW